MNRPERIDPRLSSHRHNDQIIFARRMARVPDSPPRAHDFDTIFDAASLTKSSATTPSLMKLFEQGKLRLDDPVANICLSFKAARATSRSVF